MLNAQKSAEARDKGLQLVFSTFECHAAQALLESLAARQTEITSDDLWVELESAGIRGLYQPNTLGAAFRAVALKGLIESTGRVVKSARVSARRRNVLVWRSLLFKEAQAA